MGTREAFDEASAHTQATVSIKGPAEPSGHSHFASGTLIGRYVVAELLGEGGMGAVYKAFDNELQRPVAVKVISTDVQRSGSSAGSNERLLREAQALARLSHPNVLPVYDVGTFGEQIFIATEFVAGSTLRAWLKAAPRTHHEILAAFLAAGQGLAAAHRAELIHRDFKPDNVIVGDDGRVRVLDFGLVRVARREGAAGHGDTSELVSTAPPLAQASQSASDELLERTERLVTKVSGPSPRGRDISPTSPSVTLDEMLLTPLTEMGSIMGTPRYMAPEQHRGDDVDARTDQFAFAVALYEALYGRLPFAAVSASELKERVLAGDVIAPSPKSRVPSSLWPILARALQVSPSERFPSLDAMLGELRRESARAQRRARRKTLAAFAASAAIAITVGGVAVLRQERAVCSGSARKLGGVWDPARKRQVRAAFVQTRLPYAAAAFAQVELAFDRYAHDWAAMRTDACESSLHGKQPQDLLDLRMECLDDRLSSFGAEVDVLAVADSKVVERADHAAAALPALDDCADAAALRAPVRPPADAETRARVAEVRKQLGRARALEAVGHYADGLKVATSAAAEATKLNYRPVAADALLALGTLQSSSGDPQSAVATLRDSSLAADASRAEAVRAEALILLVEVAGEELNHYADAHRFGDEAELALQQVEHRGPLLAALQRNLGILSWREGKYEVAIAQLKKALALRTSEFGAADRSVAETLSDIADALADEGKFDEALDDYRRALEIWTASLGSQHPQLAVTINNMANVLSNQGKLDDALVQFRLAEAIWSRSLGPQHPRMGAVLNNIGDTYARLGQNKIALDYYRLALPILVAAFGPEHYTVGVAYMSVGEAERALGRLDEALASYRRGLAILEKALGPTHPQLVGSLVDLGELLLVQGDSDAALKVYRRAQALAESAPGSPDMAKVLVGLGRTYLAKGADNEAVAAATRAVTLEQAHPSDPLALADARFTLARALWSQERERPQARTLALAARDAYAQAGPRGRESLATLERWLGRQEKREAVAHRP